MPKAKKMSTVNVHYMDTLYNLKGIIEEDVKFEGDWTIKDLITHLRENNGYWRKTIREYDKPIFAVNSDPCSEDHHIKDGDLVFIFNEIKNDLSGALDGLGISLDLEERTYAYFSVVQEPEGIESIPDIVLPEFDKLPTTKAPDNWTHPYYPQTFLNMNCHGNPERAYRYSGRSGKVPAAEYYSDIARFREVWQKLKDDLVRALCDGLKLVRIAHGNSYDPLKQNIRHWLIGCDWVLAYVEVEYLGGKSVNVELRRLNDDKELSIWR